MNTTLLLNGKSIHYDDLRSGSAIGETEFENSTLNFCRQWLNEQSSFSIKTSGSTGPPKIIPFTREQMLASAKQTIAFFNLRPDDTVLVCLNTAYIAGLMMLVRGFTAGSKIIAIEPSGNPLVDITETISFMAVVPLQLNNIIEEPATLLKQEAIRNTIVGGAPVSFSLQQKISKLKASVWATFGMTETLTHFGVRQLSPLEEKLFTVLPMTSIRGDERGCLIVKSDVTQNEELMTNDLVEIIDDNHFIWKGRIDNVINSGGVKFQIEDLEAKTAILFSELNLPNNFFIAKEKDTVTGEKICLIIEAIEELSEIENVNFANYYDEYGSPKKVAYLQRFVYTPTGKIDRRASIHLIDLLA